MNKELDQVYKRSKRLTIDDKTKIVIMSDCHRGTGNKQDNFLKNKNIFISALLYYYNRGFTYIELGDGDEMWEVSKYQDIITANLNLFKQLKKFYTSNRLIMIYGNHDIVKKNKSILEKNFYKYYDKLTKKNELLFKELIVQESLILSYKSHDIFLIHGHQIDFINSKLWYLSRLFVRHIWKPLEKIGLKALTSSPKNYKVSSKLEKSFKTWSIKNNKIIITGHTHRPVFPQNNQSLYFNDGSCIYPNGITCLEINNGNISLVKWEKNTNKDELITTNRRILEQSKPISNFFK